jgi:hypothetical protein
VQTWQLGAFEQPFQSSPAPSQRYSPEIVVIVVQEVEGKHCHFVLSTVAHSGQKAKEVRSAVLGREAQLGIEDRGTCRNVLKGFRQDRQAIAPIIATPIEEAHRRSSFDDLQAITVELWFVQPSVTYGHAIGRYRAARLDEAELGHSPSSIAARSLFQTLVPQSMPADLLGRRP